MSYVVEPPGGSDACGADPYFATITVNSEKSK
jgi:hypothetical protein